MDYSEVFLRQHDEMCQVVGSIVFSLVEAGHDSTSENIVAVLRNGIAESGKWDCRKREMGAGPGPLSSAGH